MMSGGQNKEKDYIHLLSVTKFFLNKSLKTI